MALAGLCVQFRFRNDYTSSFYPLFAVNAACLLYHGWWILPYTRLFRREVKDASSADPSKRIRILSSNVLTPNRNAAGLIALIREHRPDIFVTLESDAWWEKHLDTLEDDYPHSIKCPLDNLYGMHVYSRLPLQDAGVEFLVEDDIPSMHATVALASGSRIRIFFVHPTPPSPTEHDQSDQRDAELLLVAKRAAKLNMPVIVTGDLNDVAWSETTRLFRKISGLLDPRIGRGMFNTFHTGYWFLRWPLDHLFHSKHFSVALVRRLPAYGSDHFPILVELALDYPGDQEGLTADEDDKQLADEKISEVLDSNA